MICPICKKEAEAAGNPFRPFCSERCKMVDLGRWIKEDYKVPSPEDPLEMIPKTNAEPEDDD